MTMMRALRLLALPVAALAACTQTVPNSAQGVGFRDYGEYLAERSRREAELTRRPVPGIAVSSERRTIPGTPDARVASAVPSAQAFPGAAAQPAATGNPGISDEQDFSAVSSRESIESDAERLARQRALREQVPVEPLPERPVDVGPNIVTFALSTTNRVGEAIYSRRRTSAERHQAACNAYASADLAQQAFLEMGGPDRDRDRLDPDGDGFACGWNPAPFRAARAAARGNQAATPAPGTASGTDEPGSIAADALSAIGAAPIQ